MKILYVAALSPNDSALYRLWALQRLGHTIVFLNALTYESSNALVRKVTFRLVMGPAVNRLNRDLLEMAERERPDVLWADKLLGVWPKTLNRLRMMGVATVSYMIDNPFGVRHDPGWRVYMRGIAAYDLHVVQREKNITDYLDRGARDVIKVQTAYEPTIHYAPPADWSDADRDREVSFIGTPYDDRAQTLTRLAGVGEFGVTISGNEASWRRVLPQRIFGELYREGELYQQRYREAIWRSRINLSFLTHANQDEFAHKSFEIAACGGFLLAERSAGHLQRFREDAEAIFFSDEAECLAKIRRYLPDTSARQRVAAAGRKRAERDGYHNDRQVALIVARIESILAHMHGATASELDSRAR